MKKYLYIFNINDENRKYYFKNCLIINIKKYIDIAS